MRKQEEIYNELRDRIQLLSRGIRPVELHGKPLYSFSSVGAGPQGKKFFLCSRKDGSPQSMISVPVFPSSHPLYAYSLKTEPGPKASIVKAENGILLKAAPIEKFIGKTLSNGVSIVKDGISALHCYATYTMVPAWKCKHPETGEECRYCEINAVALEKHNWPEFVPVENLVEALKIAQEVEHLRTITMTSGTFGPNEDVVRRYIDLIRELKKATTLSFHVQFEPVSDTGLLRELSNYAESVGIFLEILDEKIRKEICPGKSKISKEEYVRNWEAAVEYFGWGNVSTTCLLGFGEDLDMVLKEIEKICRMGVRTNILFARFATLHLRDKTPSYLLLDEKEIMDFFIEAGRILVEHNLGYKKGVGSGCIGCGGCTAMMEASEYALQLAK